MKYYRKGALRFVKIGRFGFSWWWAKRKPNTNVIAGRFVQCWENSHGRD